MKSKVWKWEQIDAGRVYNRALFNSKEEAEEFAEKIERLQPGTFYRIEPVLAQEMWN